MCARTGGSDAASWKAADVHDSEIGEWCHAEMEVHYPKSSEAG